MDENIQKIVIVGGGFGGIQCALNLERKKPLGAKIVLISNRSHFEFYAALYRVVSGNSPLEVCVPLRDIFEGKNIEVVEDSISEVRLGEKKLIGKSGSRYSFNFLVLALGSETSYLNIEGLEKNSFGFKSIGEALRLKKHISDLFRECEGIDTNNDEKLCLLQIVVVGAGPSGVELAGELAVYMKRLAEKHHVDKTLVTVDLIEAAPRILPALPERMASKVARRLRELDVNIFTNRPMTDAEVEQVGVRGMTMRTETIVWTAGVVPNALYKQIEGLNFNKKGKVIVDEYMRASGVENVFVIGDGAATPKSGMAQTAIHDGKVVAGNIARALSNKPLRMGKEKSVAYALPVGSGWASVLMGNVLICGKLGWLIRRVADLLYFLSILPFRRALNVFRGGKNICETCNVC